MLCVASDPALKARAEGRQTPRQRKGSFNLPGSPGKGLSDLLPVLDEELHRVAGQSGAFVICHLKAKRTKRPPGS